MTDKSKGPKEQSSFIITEGTELLKALERIILSSSKPGEVVLDCFSHSGTTLIGGERLSRKVVTFDIDPVFAKLTIRRLENYRKTGRTGWQWHNPFPEMEEAYDAAITA